VLRGVAGRIKGGEVRAVCAARNLCARIEATDGGVHCEAALYCEENTHTPPPRAPRGPIAIAVRCPSEPISRLLGRVVEAQSGMQTIPAKLSVRE
jgi:hypothetical protein